MSQIIVAKRELYDKLKSEGVRVTGSAITYVDGIESMLISVAEGSDKIPLEFKGFDVLTEIRPYAKSGYLKIKK